MAALDGTVSIAGKPVSKKAVAGVIGIAVVVGGVVYYRDKQSAASTANADQAAGAADGSTTDPETGYAYGSPEDQAALAALGTDGLPSESDGGTSFQTGNVIGYDQYGNPIYGTGGGSTGYTSNSQWAAAALAAVSAADDQTDSGVISAAIGAYLEGAPLTDSQVSIIQQSIALAGSVPVPNADGYPPNYKTATSSTGTTTSGGKVTNKPAGLSSDVTESSATLRCTSLQEATSYVWVVTSGTGAVVKNTTTPVTTTSVAGLRQNTKYRWKVAGKSDKGQGPYCTEQTFTTKRAVNPK